jgi:hypothetical protein
MVGCPLEHSSDTEDQLPAVGKLWQLAIISWTKTPSRCRVFLLTSSLLHIFDTFSLQVMDTRLAMAYLRSG